MPQALPCSWSAEHLLIKTWCFIRNHVDFHCSNLEYWPYLFAEWFSEKISRRKKFLHDLKNIFPRGQFGWKPFFDNEWAQYQFVQLILTRNLFVLRFRTSCRCTPSPEGSLVRAQTHLLKLFSVYWNLPTRTSKKAHDYWWNVVFLCFVDPNLTLT